MAGKVLIIKVFSPLKQRIDLTGKCHAIGNFSNLPLISLPKSKLSVDCIDILPRLFLHKNKNHKPKPGFRKHLYKTKTRLIKIIFTFGELNHF